MTVSDYTNENTVNSVKISPNNLHHSSSGVFADLQIEFSLGSELPVVTYKDFVG